MTVSNAWLCPRSSLPIRRHASIAGGNTARCWGGWISERFLGAADHLLTPSARLHSSIPLHTRCASLLRATNCPSHADVDPHTSDLIGASRTAVEKSPSSPTTRAICVAFRWRFALGTSFGSQRNILFHDYLTHQTLRISVHLVWMLEEAVQKSRN